VFDFGTRDSRTDPGEIDSEDEIGAFFLPGACPLSGRPADGALCRERHGTLGRYVPARMIPVDAYRRLDATALADLLRREELRPVELLEAALAAVATIDPPLGSVVMCHPEEAAAQIAEGLPAGPLAGLPFLLKDLGVAQRGTRTTHGLPARYDRIARADCPTVARCRAAGLVLFGKTHSAPLGLSAETVSRRFGATRNPWDLGRSAGGSSGGAAAAVAAGIVPVAQASDGGGSLRLPAACCGLVGLMPTPA
jgi:amidase